MSEVGRRSRLIIDRSAAADLTRVKVEDPWAFAQIFAVLQEYNSGALPIEELCDEHFASESVENVVPVWHLQDDRFNVFRVKLIKVRAWRILTASDWRTREVAVLAIMKRNQNYQSDPDLMNRIRTSYESLGFHLLGR